MLEPKRFDHLSGFDGLSERSLREHYKLYAGYVERYNELMQTRAAFNSFGQSWVSSDQESLKVDISFALGAIKNHELFFDTLGPDDSEPTGPLAAELVKSFHSVPQYLIDLKQTAVSGRGWAWTVYDLDQHYLFNYDAGRGNGIPVWNAVPILAIDLYGHAYFYDFGNNKTAYVETVMAAISWKRVALRFAAAMSSRQGARHMEKKSDPAATGILPFDDAAGRIDPHATLASFDADPLAHRCTQRLYGDWTEFVLRHTRIAGQLFIITWRFEKQSLPGIELFLEQPDDGTSWADWSEEKEQRRKLAAEHWTMKAFSRELIVKPYIMEDGTTVTPFEITWQTVRHCKFPWGEIVSFFDAKGGSSGLMLKAKK